jgi:hypothetical protein
MKNRANVIINGYTDLDKLTDNLNPIFKSNDPLIFLTAFPLSKVKSHFEQIGFITDVDSELVYIERFKEFKSVKLNETTKLVVIQMPNNRFKTISGALNAVLRINNSMAFAKFLHFYSDDLKFVDNEAHSPVYVPNIYEKFMDEFGESFIIDCKMNDNNYAFKRLSPRFVFCSQLIATPISFFQYEGKDHFVINSLSCTELFDENLNRMYMSEFIIRLHEKGVVKHLTFYPDPIPYKVVERDTTLPSNVKANIVLNEYQNDEQYIRETLKKAVTPEVSVDPLVQELSTIITTKMKNNIENLKETNNV